MNLGEQRALATMICTVRPDWNFDAVARAIATVATNGTLPWVAYRCLTAAVNPDCHTPQAITFAKHWPAESNTGRPKWPTTIADRNAAILDAAEARWAELEQEPR